MGSIFESGFRLGELDIRFPEPLIGQSVTFERSR
jgi:hypothetical protein